MEPWLDASRELLAPLFADRPMVLVDVGAAGAPPVAWQALAPLAVYVGFDPDLRDLREDDSSGFRRFVMLDRAVSDGPEPEVTFHLTSGPHCSSVLPPDPRVVDRYGFSALFQVQRTASVRATTFSAALAELALPGIDWLKLDSQGKDLDLLRSLPAEVLQGLLALDVEPGLDAFYHGENTFQQLHGSDALDGFWLSRLELQHNVRVSVETREALVGTDDVEWHALPGSPTAAEARYLRTVAHLERLDDEPRAHACSWVFAMVDDKPGAALDVAARLAQRHPDLGRSLERLALDVVKAEQRRRTRSLGGVARRVLPDSLHPLVRKLRDRG